MKYETKNQSNEDITTAITLIQATDISPSQDLRNFVRPSNVKSLIFCRKKWKQEAQWHCDSFRQCGV